MPLYDTSRKSIQILHENLIKQTKEFDPDRNVTDRIDKKTTIATNKNRVSSVWETVRPPLSCSERVANLFTKMSLGLPPEVGTSQLWYLSPFGNLSPKKYFFHLRDTKSEHCKIILADGAVVVAHLVHRFETSHQLFC